uniref:Transposase (putative) gypsy type domain-containing protein n=1 Tax=Tanacetum cinerariifolium TaxID=118510 RepID=A0A699GSY7_TANCI|nr:hypothetical protein [Tanacetum cinerariifolium]
MSTITDVKCVLSQRVFDVFAKSFIFQRKYTMLPLSTFLVNILRHFRINISQLSVIGAAKVSHFEILCLVYGITLTVGLFRFFYNDHFFWVADLACPTRFPWHTVKNMTGDPALVAADFNAQDYATLVAHPSPFWKFLEEFLCLVRLCRHYTLDEKTYPLFLDKDGEDMDIFAFIHTPDPTKEKVVERERKNDEPWLLETTVGRTVSMLSVAPERDEIKPDASVDKLFDEGGSATQTKQGDFASSGVGKASKEKETIVVDAGGPSHPPKRFREDHKTLSGASVGGKSSAKAKDEEIKNLKAQRLLKEAEAAKVIHLGAEASNIKDVEKSLWDEVNALNGRNTILEKERNSLDVKVMDMKATVDAQLKVVNDKFDKLYTDFVEMTLYLEERFYPYLLTTIAGHRWLLTYGMELAIVKCLNSPEYLYDLGTSISKFIEKGMQDGLVAEITYGKKDKTVVGAFAFLLALDVFDDWVRRALSILRPLLPQPYRQLFSASSSPPISTDDYEVVRLDGQEGAGAESQGIVDGNVDPFANVDDVDLNVLQ